MCNIWPAQSTNSSVTTCLTGDRSGLRCINSTMVKVCVSPHSFLSALCLKSTTKLNKKQSEHRDDDQTMKGVLDVRPYLLSELSVCLKTSSTFADLCTENETMKQSIKDWSVLKYGQGLIRTVEKTCSTCRRQTFPQQHRPNIFVTVVKVQFSSDWL